MPWQGGVRLRRNRAKKDRWVPASACLQGSLDRRRQRKQAQIRIAAEMRIWLAAKRGSVAICEEPKTLRRREAGTKRSGAILYGSWTGESSCRGKRRLLQAKATGTGRLAVASKWSSGKVEIKQFASGGQQVSGAAVSKSGPMRFATQKGGLWSASASDRIPVCKICRRNDGRRLVRRRRSRTPTHLGRRKGHLVVGFSGE